jgi:DNA-binding transcriptional LysR family regulator
MFDLEALSTFVEIAEAGSVSAAARRLGLPKSVVSRRLVRLEQDLGAQLIVRTTRGMALTEAGTSLRERALRIVAELEAAREEIAPEGDVRGSLRISAPLSFGATHLAPVFAELARRHAKLHIHAAYSDRFVDLVGEGFDVAVRLGYLPDSNLVVRRIAAVGGKCVASPEYLEAHGTPLTPEEVLGHECLLQPAEVWRFVSEGQTTTVRPQGRFKADNGTAIVAAAIAGLGIARLPDFLIDEHIASGALKTLLVDYPPPQAGLYLLRPRGDFSPRKVRVLADILVERFGADVTKTGAFHKVRHS